MQHQIYWGPLKKPIEWSPEDGAGALVLHRQRAVPRHVTGTRATPTG
ncbi:MAG: hypothetical protein M0C28_13540 [Candidatus Moduliflexus flocculans]|nr:hypothetical protein [Candidatus Moduliflexus flocculans]